MKSNLQLVTTALRNYWPENGPIWLLSPACRPDPNDPSIEPRWKVQGVISDPWQDPEKRQHAYREIQRIADSLTAQLTPCLNRLHGVTHSERYWRILIGSWSMFFTLVVYDRYHRLQLAREKLGNITILGMATEHYRTEATTRDFVVEASDDLLNVQLYVELAGKLSIPTRIVPHSTRSSAVDEAILAGRSFRVLAVKGIYQLLQNGLNVMLGKRAKLVMMKPLLPLWVELLMSVKTGMKAWPYHAPMYVPAHQHAQNDYRLREQLMLPSDGTSEIEAVVRGMAANHIPRCFAEDYDAVRSFADETYRGLSPRAILSMGEWHFDEGFKFWAARCSEQGTKLVAGQHGLNYGLLQDHLSRDHEVSVVDTYLTWGWKKPITRKYVPSPASYLIRVNKRKGEGKSKILFCATAEARHRVATLLEFEDYFERQKQFIRSLDETTRTAITYRPHIQNYGRDLCGRLGAEFPEIMFEFWNLTLRRSLIASRMVVVDCVSTAFCEALAIGVPCVLLTNAKEEEFQEEAVGLLQGLKKAGVVHTEPESAADWVAKVYPDPMTWWQSESCQTAVAAFVRKYSYQSRSPLKDWCSIAARLIEPPTDESVLTEDSINHR